MRVVLEVEDEKAGFLIEILSHFDFVKLDDATVEKARIIDDLRESVIEVNRAKHGEIELRNAQELLDEL